MKNALFFAGLLGFIAVAIGAMGAHALKPHLDAYQMQIFEKGVQYHFYHTLAILAIGIAQFLGKDSPRLHTAGTLFLGGIICFSGSLYLLACRHLLPFPVGWAGPVTPIGGVLFMGGWAILAWEAWKNR